MILIINVCKEKLHYFEFVKPIEDIIKKGNYKFITRHYSKISQTDVKTAEKIIICGTSLKDNYFIKDIGKFKWILKENKPILGICAGMQIIGEIFNENLRKKTEIGYYDENFHEFLNLKGHEQVYHLHNFYTDFRKTNEFNIFSEGKIPQAVKHKNKEIYGVLFHPEVRQKDMIKNFIAL